MGNKEDEKAYLQQPQVSLHEQQYAFHKYISSVRSDELLSLTESIHVAGHYMFLASSVPHNWQTDPSSLPAKRNRKN